MIELNTDRIPISDLSIEDEPLLDQYNAELDNGNLSSAVEKLDNAKCNRGIRASIFNAIKQSILELETYILNLTADDDTLYSLTEPTPEQMGDKLYWIQPR